MSKVKGYTLVDVLFGMMFIGVVVALSMTAYSLILKNTFSLNKTKQKVSREMRLHSTLNQDLWRADSIRTNPEGFMIYVDTNEISYTVSDEHFIRQQQTVLDTFLRKTEFFDYEEGKLDISYTLFGEAYSNSYFNSKSVKDNVNQQTQKLVDRYQ